MKRLYIRLFALMFIFSCSVSQGCSQNKNSDIDPVASANSHANLLERAKQQIDYCFQNLGKSTKNVDLGRVGTRWDYVDVCIISYGLIAKKFNLQYGDVGRAADYYYLDWRDTPGDDCASPGGEYMPFRDAIRLWEEAGRYIELAEHYEEYLLSLYSPLKSPDSTREEKWKDLELWRPSWPKDAEERFQANLKKWAKYKKMAKARVKPNPLDPDVQHHEWFYSDKQDEVLKALAYYYKYQVRFMLEKAAKRDDKVIAAKAREYLKKLGTDSDNEEKTK